MLKYLCFLFIFVVLASCENKKELKITSIETHTTIVSVPIKNNKIVKKHTKTIRTDSLEGHVPIPVVLQKEIESALKLNDDSAKKLAIELENEIRGQK